MSRKVERTDVASPNDERAHRHPFSRVSEGLVQPRSAMLWGGENEESRDQLLGVGFYWAGEAFLRHAWVLAP